MPQFSKDPLQPGSIYLDTAKSQWGQVAEKKAGGNGGGKGKSASASSATVSRPASSPSKNDNKGGKGGKGGNNGKGGKGDKGKKPPYNPLYEPFLTPKQIRAEAARLAALSVPSTQAIQQQYAAEQAGIQGLGGALSARLGDIAAQQTAGLAGFGDLYSKLAGGAQTAGTSAAVAAGAPAAAPGATPTVANTFARQAYAVTGYQPAAEATTTRLAAQSRANLTKALVDRAAKVSADTAKYIRDLKDRELQRSLSLTTAEQNQARLGLSQQQEAWNQRVDAARLSQGQQRIDIQLQKLQDARLKAGGSGDKAISSVKKGILSDPYKWTNPRSVFSGTNTYKIVVDTALGGPQEFTVQGATPEDALASAKAKYPSVANNPNVTTGNLTYVGPVQSQQLPSRGEVVSMLVNQLVNAGMRRNQAQRWVLANLPQLSTLPA